jgi:hypothetical protein
MKGNILDFLKLAAEKPELAQELVDLAAKYEFEFSDEVSDEELDSVAGGATAVFANALSVVHKSGGASLSSFPDVCATPAAPSPIPIPYPNIGGGDSGTGSKQTKSMDREGTIESSS